MTARLCCMAGLAALILAVTAAQPAPAEELNRVVRTIDRILNPEDARRYEERAHRAHRADEEHYWHDYRAGLEEQHRERGIQAEEARRYEAAARHSHKADEERYWHNYRLGLH